MSSKGESDMDLMILVGGLHWQLGSLWRGELLGFRLVRAFFGSIGAYRSCDRFDSTTWKGGGG
jgi:hypothetical protein